MRPTTKPTLLVVGNGMAGARAVTELLKINAERYRIIVFGSEPYGNYDRIQLSPLLAGDKTLDRIMLNSPGWYAERGIELHTGTAVVAIDRTARSVTDSRGRQYRYDRLLLATGSQPLRLPLPGSDLAGVTTFRNLEDANRLLAALDQGCRRAVVIGGGLLGLEAGYGLRRHGVAVSVVHLAPYLMERQLDAAAGALLCQRLGAIGIDVLTGAQTEALLDGGGGRVGAVRLQNGRELAAEQVVMAVGIRPETALAAAAGLRCERGVVVNDAMQTSDPAVYAVGECVQHRGRCYGLVAPLWQQARVAAAQLAGDSGPRFTGATPYTTLKVSGIDVFSAGEFSDDSDINGPERQTLLLNDPGGGVYKKLVLRENRLTGAVLVGDRQLGAWYLELIETGADIGGYRDQLMFGPARAVTMPKTQALAA